MKEYGIYIRQGAGTPYMIHFFDNIDSAKLKVYEMILLEEERGRPYFVDNDYFENKYTLVSNLRYICIKERDVSNWSNYSKSHDHTKDNKNIFYLSNYK